MKQRANLLKLQSKARFLIGHQTLKVGNDLKVCATSTHMKDAHILDNYISSTWNNAYSLGFHIDGPIFLIGLCCDNYFINFLPW